MSIEIEIQQIYIYIHYTSKTILLPFNKIFHKIMFPKKRIKKTIFNTFKKSLYRQICKSYDSLEQKYE